MKRKPRLPMVSMAIAEKVLRDIARREGEAIKKRRSRTQIDHYGPGYMIYDPYHNTVLSGSHGPGGHNDCCGNTLSDLATRYESRKRNTPWQCIVLSAIKAGRVKEPN